MVGLLVLMGFVRGDENELFDFCVVWCGYGGILVLVNVLKYNYFLCSRVRFYFVEGGGFGIGWVSVVMV